MTSISLNPAQVRPGVFRQAMGLIALATLGVAIFYFADLYLNKPIIHRPHDFVQVWASGQLTLAGESPYDAKRVLEIQRELDLQVPKHPPRLHASMMWVPPWGIAVALPIGALSLPYAQAVWVFGQLALILACVLLLWRLNCGRADQWWVPLLLAMTFGPVFWQAIIGQYAGIVLFGLVGYLLALKANRPMLAGLSLALCALKPHLFVLFGIGLLIDASRTGFGRRVVLGGIIGILLGAATATIASPAIWEQYLAAIGRSGSSAAPGLRDWFNPTIQAWIRFATPGQSFWIQTIPCGVAAIAFGIYWWRVGNPCRWPKTLQWLIPAGLLLAPYGSWTSDLTLMLVPFVAVAARAAAQNWALPGRVWLASLYLSANLLAVLMLPLINNLPICPLVASEGKGESMRWGREVKNNGYCVWVAPVLWGCLLWAQWGVKPQRRRLKVEFDNRTETCRIQPQPSAL